MTRALPAILPCPFCGSKAVEPDGGVGELRGKNAMYSVCQDCHACGPMAMTVRGSITVWNRRGVTPLPEAATLAREIHQALKRGAATEDHGLIGNLKCILDHVLPDPPPLG